MLQETSISSGQTRINGTIAYVEQEPFIFSGTIRENILFGKAYNEKTFNTALEMSSLVVDVEDFQKGTDTIIGERGINISGGQKARISLARALYSEADIYLFDDPLSAVDPQVANDIFQNCIQGFLSNKLVVLVTHQLQFLKTCDNILVIKDGKQAALGNYESIIATGFDIEEILKSYNQQLKNKEDGQQDKFNAETTKGNTPDIVDKAK